MTEAPPDMVAGARQALLAIMRARRPDLTWEVGYFDADNGTRRATSSGSFRSIIRGYDRHTVKSPAPGNPNTTDCAA